MQVRDYVAKQGWKPVDFTDPGVSRAKTHRGALDALRRAVRRRDVDAIVVPALDRLVGSLSQLVGIMEDLNASGVRLVSLREAVDSATPAGKALLQMSAVFSEFERAIIRERIMAGLERARRQGKRLGRPRKGINMLEVEQLMDGGLSMAEVSRRTGIPRRTIKRAIDRGSDLSENPYEPRGRTRPVA